MSRAVCRNMLFSRIHTTRDGQGNEAIGEGGKVTFGGKFGSPQDLHWHALYSPRDRPSFFFIPHVYVGRLLQAILAAEQGARE